MKSTGRGLVTVAALLAGMAQAQDCREQLPQILASAYGAAPPVALEQVICKAWPARSELTLVAGSKAAKMKRYAKRYANFLFSPKTTKGQRSG